VLAEGQIEKEGKIHDHGAACLHTFMSMQKVSERVKPERRVETREEKRNPRRIPFLVFWGSHPLRWGLCEPLISLLVQSLWKRFMGL